MKYKTSNIYCIIGNSGSGKTTIAEALSRNYGLSVLPSYTTRAKRNHGDKDHIYISDKQYDEITDKVASRIRPDGKYCATRNQIDECDLYVIDFDGLSELKQKYKGNKNIYAIYINVSIDVCKDRMLGRGDDILKVANRVKDDILSNTKDKIDTCDLVINGEESIMTYLYVWDFIKMKEDFVNVISN